MRDLIVACMLKSLVTVDREIETLDIVRARVKEVAKT